MSGTPTIAAPPVEKICTRCKAGIKVEAPCYCQACMSASEQRQESLRKEVARRGKITDDHIAQAEKAGLKLKINC